MVVAIIGLLAAVVLGSLNQARNRGTDAAIKETVQTSRAEAALYASLNGNSFEGACAITGTNVIGAIIVEADRMFDKVPPASYSDSTAATPTTGACHDSVDDWVTAIPLRVGGYYCIDSAGKATTTATALAANAMNCP